MSPARTMPARTAPFKHSPDGDGIAPGRARSYGATCALGRAPGPGVDAAPENSFVGAASCTCTSNPTHTSYGWGATVRLLRGGVTVEWGAHNARLHGAPHDRVEVAPGGRGVHRNNRRVTTNII